MKPGKTVAKLARLALARVNTMPVKSQAQKKMFEAVAHGWKDGPSSLSQAEAKKFLKDSPKGAKLPKKVKQK